MNEDIRTPHGEDPIAQTSERVPHSRRWVLIFVVLLVIAGLGLAGARWGKSVWQNVTKVASEQAAQNVYQAVFLTNGQVYFGNVEDDARDPVILQDVYYLRVTQQLQPVPDPEESPQSVPQISLVKLGNELHGPTDEMRITRSQILFIEDLKEDSAVVRAITEFKSARE